MKPWPSRVAIFAYVIGGWLLPASHHHDHTCTHRSVQNTAEHQCCHHARVDDQQFESFANPNLFSVDEQPDLGLCALCAARCLAKSNGDRSSLIEVDDHNHIFSGFQLRLSLSCSRRANQTRGPPVII